MEVRGSVKHYSGRYYTIFIDFKNAFDRVDHKILLERLHDTGISDSSVNIVKLLYNSYSFSIKGSKPLKINSGVA